MSTSHAPSGAATPVPSSTIDAHELRQHLDGVRLLDVRTASEYETAHIHGSYHVPLDTLGEHCTDVCGGKADVSSTVDALLRDRPSSNAA